MPSREESSGDIEREAYRLNEDILLAGSTLNDALYVANRYQRTGYEHRKEKAVDCLRGARVLIDDALERYDESGTEQEGPK